MTICLAVICDEGRAVVVASDKMVSARFLDLEFEHPSSKIDEIADTCIGLTAGDALADIALFRATKSNIQQIQAPSVELIAGQVKQYYSDLRRHKAEERYLEPRGITLNEFYHEGLICRFPNEVSLPLDVDITRYDFGLEVIIAGVDVTGAHIYGIYNPGIINCYDGLGYHAVGSGERHALLTIVASNHSQDRTVKETVFLVYEAKRRAEVAQGVGKLTEMAIIKADGIRPISETEQVELSKIYEIKTAPQLGHVNKAISELRFNGDDDGE